MLQVKVGNVALVSPKSRTLRVLSWRNREQLWLKSTIIILKHRLLHYEVQMKKQPLTVLTVLQLHQILLILPAADSLMAPERHHLAQVPTVSSGVAPVYRLGLYHYFYHSATEKKFF